MRIGVIVATLAAGELLSAQPATQSPHPPVKLEPCSIEGQITSSQTGEPLRKAEVVLWQVGSRGDQRYETTSTSSGRFILRDLEPGRYTISATKRGYAKAEYGTHGHLRSGTTLSVDPGQHLENVLLRMSPQAVITGRVLDDDGEALPGVEVFLLGYTFVDGRRQLTQSDQAMTNDLGEYRMFGLSPGKYYLSATAVDFSSRPQRYDSGRGFAPTYYPATTDPAGAKAIELQAGTLLRGADISLARTRTVRVSGHVVDPTSKQSNPINQNVGVNLVRRGDNEYMFFGNFYSGVDAQGNFEVRGVVPGAYFVEANRRGEGKAAHAEQAIDVRESDIEDIVLELSAAGELKGQLRIEGRPPTNMVETSIWLEFQEHPFTGGAGGHARADGSFTLTDVQPTRYQLRVFNPSEDHYLKSARLGDQNVLDSGLDLTHGFGGSLDIVLSTNGGQVEGVVLNASDQPESGAVVVLAPDEPRRSQSRLYKQAITDQYGRFTIKSIAPGGYRLFAWEEVDGSGYENPEFLKPFEPLGEPRTIREGSRDSAQLKLIPREAPRNK